MELIKSLFIRYGLPFLFACSLICVVSGVGLFFISNIWRFDTLVVGITRTGSYVLGSGSVVYGIGVMGLVFVLVNGFAMWALSFRSRFLALFIGWGSLVVSVLIFIYFAGIVSLQ